MVRFTGINWTIQRKSRVAGLLATLAICLVLSGCSLQPLDKFRPEVNNHEGMIANPNMWDAGYELTISDGTAVDDDDRASGSEVTGGGTGEGTAELNQYSPLPYDVVDSISYTEYLKAKIEQPMTELLEGLDASTRNNLYFRIYHVGQNLAPEGSDESISRSATYNFSRFSSTRLTSIGGDTLPDFVYTYLTKRYDNQVIRDTLLNTFKTRLRGFSDGMTYEQARTNENFPSDIVSMWGRASNLSSCSTLARLASYAESHPERVVPGLSLRVLAGATSTREVKLNDTTAWTTRIPFPGGIRRTAFETVLTSTSQFTENNFDVKLSVTGTSTQDSKSVVWAYIDNYSTTIVVLACESTKTLADVMGSSNLNSAKQIILSDTYSWDKTSNIRSYLDGVHNVSIIEKGVRGS